jgi:hypothetical protein
MSVIIDDMVFEEYSTGGLQCKIKTQLGVISVRCKSRGLIVDKNNPYEVWYPTETAPIGCQNVNDIYMYIKAAKKNKKPSIVFR